jgi:hypothetical protein
MSKPENCESAKPPKVPNFSYRELKKFPIRYAPCTAWLGCSAGARASRGSPQCEVVKEGIGGKLANLTSDLDLH